jgi:hypothetical protein
MMDVRGLQNQIGASIKDSYSSNENGPHHMFPRLMDTMYERGIDENKIGQSVRGHMTPSNLSTLQPKEPPMKQPELQSLCNIDDDSFTKMKRVSMGELDSNSFNSKRRTVA